MRIIAGTDFHGSKPAFEALVREADRHCVDAIIVCGDVTNFGTFEQAKSLLSLLAGTGIPVFFVPGNCDPPSIIDLNFNGLRCIHGVNVLFKDFILMGVGGSPVTPFNTFFEMSEDEILEVLRRCLSGIESFHEILIVSHAPPKNTRLDRTFLGLHVGSESLRRFIEEHKPLLTVCGHIHEARGKDLIGRTIIVNPGPARHGNYALLNVEKNNVKVDLLTMKV